MPRSGALVRRSSAMPAAGASNRYQTVPTPASEQDRTGSPDSAVASVVSPATVVMDDSGTAPAKASFGGAAADAGAANPTQRLAAKSATDMSSLIDPDLIPHSPCRSGVRIAERTF